MKKGLNKKGYEMAFSTIVVIILSLMVLVFLIMALTGSFKDFREKIGVYFSSSNVDLVIESCNNLVLQNSNYEYCCVDKTVRLSRRNKFEMNCLAASEESWGAGINKLDCGGIC